jgi:hypothetical protein
VSTILPLRVVAFLLVVAAAGFVIGAIRGRNLRSGLEPVLLAVGGSLLARWFVLALLALAHQSVGASLMIGWGFFLWPGAIDSVALIVAHKQLLTTPSMLSWIATGVGAFVGMMDGVYAIHRWPQGIVAFVADTTWALAGSTNGALLHVVNVGWGDHAADGRTGAHRYRSGFRVKSGYAFTQGAVMSDLVDGPGRPLFAHERTHTTQSRVFGPFYTLTYIGWLALWVIPGLIAGAATGVGPSQGAQRWCYFNCPWEAWGYAVQKATRPSVAGDGRLIWPDLAVMAVSIPFFAGAIALLVLAVRGVL